MDSLIQQVLSDPSKYPRELPSWIAKYFSGNKLLQIDPGQLSRAKTQPAADNSSLIATTAFVKAQGYLKSFNGRTAQAVVPTAGDYTAAQVTNAADLSKNSEQDFSAVIGASNFWGTEAAQVNVAGGGSFTPNAGLMHNWANLTSGSTITIATPTSLAGGSSRVPFFALTITNGTGANIANLSPAWGTAYRFGSTAAAGAVNNGLSFTWVFVGHLLASRYLCIGTCGPFS